jgi:hypothetical protein
MLVGFILFSKRNGSKISSPQRDALPATGRYPNSIREHISTFRDNNCPDPAGYPKVTRIDTARRILSVPGSLPRRHFCDRQQGPVCERPQSSVSIADDFGCHDD